jgi:hypothetical protein
MKRHVPLVHGVLILAAILVAAPSSAQTFNGASNHLLPNQNPSPTPSGPNDLPKTFQQIQATATNTRTATRYVGNAGANGGPFRGQPSGGGVQPPVTCNGHVIGTMYFEFGAFTGTRTDSGLPMGGMLIRGGFTFDPLCALAPGHELRWLQVFRETGGAGQTTIDGNPLYPNHTQAGYDALLFDAPNDVWSPPAANAPPTRLEFESALVCYDTANPKALHAIGSFLWGYDIDNANQTINNEYALIFTPGPTALLTTTFNNEFGPSGTRDTGWSLDNNCSSCFECVPEPLTVAIFALTFSPLLNRRLRATAIQWLAA